MRPRVSIDHPPGHIDSKHTIDHELTGGQGTDHDETGTQTSEETLGAQLTGHLDQSRGGTLSGLTLGLVDLGEQGVGGLRDLAEKGRISGVLASLSVRVYVQRQRPYQRSNHQPS